MNASRSPSGGRRCALNRREALIVASAFSIMEGRTRREWKLVLETLRLIGVSWSELLVMQSSDAWKWLGWDAARYREWENVRDIAESRIQPAVDAGLSVISDLDASVPKWLRLLQTVPWVFYQGNLAIMDHTTLGFSGQRDAGEQSLVITRSLAEDAARLGYTVVSGGARGIDMAAHAAVLEAGGHTAVILPQGLLTWNPPFALSNPEVADSALAISEDVPWEDWNTESAMRRNRMIVELSDVFVVPQSGTSGGSHSTGMYALRKHHVTFVPDLGAQYPGNQRLLRHGAKRLEMVNGRHDLEQMLASSIPAEKPTQTSLF